MSARAPGPALRNGRAERHARRRARRGHGGLDRQAARRGHAPRLPADLRGPADDRAADRPRRRRRLAEARALGDAVDGEAARPAAARATRIFVFEPRPLAPGEVGDAVRVQRGGQAADVRAVAGARGDRAWRTRRSTRCRGASTRIDPPGPSQATSAPFARARGRDLAVRRGLAEHAVAAGARAVVEQAQLGAARARPGDEPGLARADGGRDGPGAGEREDARVAERVAGRAARRTPRGARWTRVAVKPTTVVPAGGDRDDRVAEPVEVRPARSWRPRRSGRRRRGRAR